MKTLFIIASPRGEMSKSIEIGNYISEKIGGEIIKLDVHKENIPYIPFPVIAVNYGFGKYEDLSSEDKKIADLQSRFITQVKEAQNIIIATPMWNFGMPAALKAWFDLIVKINDTFAIENGNYKGLVDNNKKVMVVGARGGKYIGTNSQSYDKLTDSINGLLGFIGLSPTNFWLEGVNMSSEEELISDMSNIKKNIDLYLTN